MRKIMTIIALCLATCTLWAQNEVNLVVSGEGKDKEEATFKALRSAIEQAYGTFVSANTTVLNDQLLADEIVSLSSGNIQKYEYVSENKMPNGNTLVTLSATVSIDKLVSFAESKGMEAELKGSLFAMNIKKKEFDKQAEEKAVENLCKQLETTLPTLFDYEIKLEEPKMGYDDKVHVEYRIYASVNENMTSFCKNMVNQLYAISLSKKEINDYMKINIEFRCLKLQYPCAIACLPFLTMLCEKYDLQFKEKTGYGIGALANIYKENPVLIRKPTQSPNEKIGYKSENVRIKKEIWAIPLSDIPTGIKISFTGDLSLEVHFELPNFYFRSYKSIELIKDLFQQFHKQLYNVEISDGISVLFPDEKSMIPSFEEGNMSEKIGYEKVYGSSFWEWAWNGIPHSVSKFLIYKGTLVYSKNDISNVSQISVRHYTQEEISKNAHTSVSEPFDFDNEEPFDFDNDEPFDFDNIISTESAPQESNNNSQADEEIVQIQSKLPLYNDTLQQAVNEYNTLLKQYPYNYNENRIAYTLSSELPNDEVFLRDTLHTLLKIISEKTAQLVERYKKDSLEFKQMSQSLQGKINEANAQLLNYPYNLQKRTLKDSLSINLFGKTEELTNELRMKTANLPKMQEQVEKEVYEKLILDDPQRFTEIYFTQNPSKKQEADKSYIECRCKYKERLVFDMAFIHNTLTDCDCREKEYQIVSEFFHSREDFDQMFNQEESAYNMELNNLKSMMADKKAIEEILFNSKQLNFKKSMLTSNEDLKSVVNRINEHKGKYYYADVIDAVFKLNDKLAKEWEKNGTYFKSKAEMFEYWISEEYDKVLKARKKE